ncbi:peptidoglycan-binding protein [Puniceibacterium confluentis]|uniref:peptidoglycan-binding protein n=1 Tax=Puniceibacterium confluentis TaxID=1958944 RepID=UPI00356B498F
MKRLLLGSVAALALAGTAWAESDALIIGNSDYSVLERLTGADGVLSATAPLEREGFQVVAIGQATANQMQNGFDRFLSGLSPRTDRVAVVLSGRFVHTSTDSYLLPVEMSAPLDDAAVLRDGLPLSQVMAVLGSYPGQALLLLGIGDSGRFSGRFVTGGLGDLVVPQGVSVLQGPAADVARFVRNDLGARGERVLESGVAAGLKLSGYAPRDYVFVNNSAAVPSARPAPQPVITPAPAALGASDDALWNSVRQRDDVAGYRNYLAAFPRGAHASDARARISAIEAEPFRDARLGEEALNLDRDARREIQRDLSLLDFNTRGIDGIFGPGSRAAVQKWQAQNGFAASGFLNREQIARLDGQAERRAGELEAEARARQIEQERLDRAYWNETGARGDATDLRAYLKRYPDGVFAELAQERLRGFEDEQRRQAAARDREAWDQARANGSVAAYDSYLNAFPNGAFAEQAKVEIDARQVPSAKSQAQARAEASEAALNLNVVARRLAENRLESLGLKPGEVDGVFDEKTRRAIRRYQDARSLDVTGYLDQVTVVRLLADSLLR